MIFGHHYETVTKEMVQSMEKVCDLAICSQFFIISGSPPFYLDGRDGLRLTTAMPFHNLQLFLSFTHTRRNNNKPSRKLYVL